MQEAAHEAFRAGGNMVLLSPTGSGKTLAYLLPLLQSLDANADTVQAIVLVPSRELAVQTQQVAARAATGIRSLAVYGGRPAMDEHRQMNGLRPHVIIGTPGRMLDHLQKGNIVADGVRCLVIDEFDKSLELGFQQEMQAVTDFMPKKVRKVLLSATDSEQIPRFIGDMSAAARLDFRSEGEARERIEQYVVHSPVKDKLETLAALLRTRGQERSIVFLGYRESVLRVATFLARQGFAVSDFHGGMDQKVRERNLFRFASGCSNVLVSTDLASRGLDIPAVDNAIHYHLPIDAATYTHRIGRTARWDATGRSFLLLGPEESWQGSEGLQDYAIPERLPAVMPPLWDTLYIGRGKKDKLSRGDVAGFMMKVAGLSRDDLGSIQLQDHHAFVAVRRSRVTETLARVRNQKIKGMKTLIERIKA